VHGSHPPKGVAAWLSHRGWVISCHGHQVTRDDLRRHRSGAAARRRARGRKDAEGSACEGGKQARARIFRVRRSHRPSVGERSKAVWLSPVNALAANTHQTVALRHRGGDEGKHAGLNGALHALQATVRRCALSRTSAATLGAGTTRSRERSTPRSVAAKRTQVLTAPVGLLSKKRKCGDLIA